MQPSAIKNLVTDTLDIVFQSPASIGVTLGLILLVVWILTKNALNMDDRFWNFMTFGFMVLIVIVFLFSVERGYIDFSAIGQSIKDLLSSFISQ